jgi:hypothetical protein
MRETMMADYWLLPSTDRGGRKREIHVSASDHGFPPQMALPPIARAAGGTTYPTQPKRQNCFDGAGRSAFTPPRAFEKAEEAKAFYAGLTGFVAAGVLVWVAGRWAWRKVS